MVTAYLANLQLHFNVGGLAPPLGASAALRPCCTTSAGQRNRPDANIPPARADLAARTPIVAWRDRLAPGLQASRAVASPLALISSSLVLQRIQGRPGARGGEQAMRQPARMSSPAARPSTSAWLPLRTRSALVSRATRSALARARGKGLGLASSLAGAAAPVLRHEPCLIPTNASWRHPAPRSAAVARFASELRVAEMVWRARTDGETTPSSQGAGAWRGAARAAAAALEAAPAAAAREPDRPALTPDPSLMERLANDVIRRIDRRERIARERRGL